MNNIYIYILVMAVATYLIRVIPLLFIKKEITNKRFKSFLYYVPYACLAAMAFPSILYSTSYLLSALVGLIFAIYFSYKEYSMVKVALIACAIVYAIEVIIKLV